METIAIKVYHFNECVYALKVSSAEVQLYYNVISRIWGPIKLVSDSLHRCTAAMYTVQQVIVNNMAAEGEIGWLTDICVLLVQR